MAQRKPKKVLITGANGFIGNMLMAHYRAQGIPVVGVDLSGNGLDISQGDIGQPETISQLLQDCDVVVHTAALVSYCRRRYVASQCVGDSQSGCRGREIQSAALCANLLHCRLRQ